MKIQVLVTNSNKAAANPQTIDATVGPTDTVLNVQEHIASVTKTFSFPDQKILLKGKVLPSSQRLSDFGVKEGDVLEFQFQASEQTIVKQFSDLLGQKAMSPMELSLMYSYRYAVSAEDALKALGFDQLRTFLQNQKCFTFQGDCVKLATEKTVQPSSTLPAIKEDKAHGIIEVNVAVEVQVAGRSPELLEREDEDMLLRLEASDTVARAKEIIAANEQMPFPHRDLMLGERKLEDTLSLGESGVKNGSNLVMVVHASENALADQLGELLHKRAALSPSELGLHYCQRFGTPVGQALRTLGLHTNLARFLEGQPQFSVKGGCVTLANGPKLRTPLSQQEETNAMDALDDVMNLLCEASFLNVDHVEKGRGADSEVQATIFVKGLPPSRESPLLHGLQKAVASTLQSIRGGDPCIESAKILGDAVQVQVEGSPTVSLRLAGASTRLQ